MDPIQAIQDFKNLTASVQQSAVLEFLGWIRSNIDDMFEEAQEKARQNSDIILDTIREELRELLPMDAMSPSEHILVPISGPNSDCDPKTTLHVDDFLYDDDTIDDLCDDGKMSRNYCKQCGSREINPLTFITHSASVKQIKYMFQYLLPDVRGKTILDVGSRTGAVLYGAYLFSGASKIIGVELDTNFCELQQKMVAKYGFQDRIQVIHEDIMNCLHLLQEADVIILNNVFEFFMATEAQIHVWELLYSLIHKPGTLLITVPSMEENLQHLQTNIDLRIWLKEVDTRGVCRKANICMYGQEDSEDSNLKSIHLYEVLPRTNQ